MTKFSSIKPLLLGFLFLVFALNSFAQKFHFDNYNVKEGLAQSSVYTIAQDKSGVLWLGTASGLSRFDGKEFINYTTEDGLADGSVRAIHIDSIGNLWLGHTNGGVTRLKSGKFEIMLNMSADITSFTEDDEGNLWVSSHGEGALKVSDFYQAEINKIDFKQYKGQEGLSDLVFQVMMLNTGKVCFITNVGVRYYISASDEFKPFKVDNMPAYFQITYMYQAKNKDIWFGSYNGGLYHLNAKTNELKIYDVRDGIASNWISTISEDQKGNIWAGTWGEGISKIEKDKIVNLNNKNGLKDNYVRCVFEDREGNMLIGSKENGLFVYKGSQFVSFGKENGLIDNQVWAITTDGNGNHWLGTNKGISVLSNSKSIKNYNQNNGLFYEEVRFIKADKNKTLWIGTWGGGVMKFNQARQRFEMNFMINSYMSQPLITALDVDKSNNLWIGTTDGLVYYEIDNQKAARLTQSNGLSGNEISAIYTDSKNMVWVGARGRGFTKIDDDQISAIKLNIKMTPTSFIEDSKGNLWIGTEGKGVFVYDGNKIIQQYTLNDGMLSDYISLLNIDNDGNIWIGTNKGLNKYDVAQNRFFSFTDKMGYVGIESKHNATYKDENGNLWFGTIDGAVRVNTQLVKENKLEPLTKITGFKVNLEEREMTSGLELNYQEKSIVFNYSSICITNPDEVYYKVMLEGLEEDWRPGTQQTYVTYSPLPPGNYTFKVIACNNHGVWNSKPITYSFSIIPPLWQRTWFIITCAILLIIAIVLFIKLREKALIKEKKVLEEKVQERTEEVVEKSKEIESKNKDIIDSITYAKRIQEAILPDHQLFVNELKKTFVLFQPKDIVSGDFYWLATKDNKALFAAVDCTGHGVPGAFMSIVGHNLLDKIVGEYGITEPASILNELNKGVSDTLRQKADAAVKDGMDMALCAFDPNNKILEYAGAYNPIYIISKDKLEVLDGEEAEPNMTENGLMLYEIKGDRFPIGSYSDEKKEFKSHRFKLKEGDTIYLFSDGYADQFGGDKGKKFMYKNLKRLFLSMNPLSMEEQKEKLLTELKSWRGPLEQVDDIVVIGSRL